MRSQEPNPDIAEQAFALAQALEAVEPDRIHSIEMYLVTWKAGHARPDALARARALCHETENLRTAATIARLQYQQTRDPDFLLLEGLAWLDSKQPDRAVRPLIAAQKGLPDSDAVRMALATARNEWPDARAAATRLSTAADQSQDAVQASAWLLNAARILRGVGAESSEYQGLLRRAVGRHPWNESAYALLEAHFIEHGEDDELLHINEARALTADTPERAVDAYRRTGTKLVLRSARVGLGMRLLLKSIELAHGHDLASIPGHVATLTLLRSFAEKARLIPQFLNLLSEGLAKPLSDDDRAWLAATGLDLAWNRFRKPELAYGYAVVAAELAPEHPVLAAFLTEGGMALGEVITKSEQEDDSIYLDQRAAQQVGEDKEDNRVGLEYATPRKPEPEPAPEPEPVPDPEPAPEPELAPAQQISNPVDSGWDEEPKPEPEEQAAVISSKPPAAVGSVIPTSALAALRRMPVAPPKVTDQPPVLPEGARQRAERVVLSADVEAKTRAHVSTQDATFAAVTRDVSATGVFLITETQLEIGTVIHVALMLPSADGCRVQSYSVPATVVRHVPGHGYGLHFVDPPAELAAHINELVKQRQ